MNSPTSAPSKLTTAAALLLLAMMALLAGGAVRQESITFDEVAHIGAGVSYLQKFDLRLNQEHPPLAKAFAALPLVLSGVKADYSNASWTFSGSGFFKQFFGEWVFGHLLIATWNNPIRTVFWARMPMLLLTLILGWLLYVYGVKLGGPAGGLLCVCAYATAPAFITFGPLVLTDLAITLLSLLTLWTFADMWRSPSPGTIWKFALALGGALLTKFSSGLLFFCFLAFILSLRFRRVSAMPIQKAELRAWRRRRWGALFKGTLLAAVFTYAVYFVFSWNQPTSFLSQIPHFPAAPLFRRLVMPPAIFLSGLISFAFTASRGTFILGHSYPHGEWFYFPIMFVLKSPLAFLGLLLLALVVSLVVKARIAQPATIPPEWELHWRAVWVFLLIFTAFCMISRMTISIRHFFIPMVLMILLLAPLPRMLAALGRSGWRPARAASWLTVALAVIMIVVALRTYPYYMPFLNSLSMGKPNYELVNDSNEDWNQALPAVEHWVQQRGLQHVLLDEYGFFDSTVYVPQSEYWNCQDPTPPNGISWAVVSAASILDAHNCRWLLQYPHEAIAAGSMYAFQLPAVFPPMGAPNGPPLPADRHSLGGVNPGFDVIQLFRATIRDPNQLQPIWDRMMAEAQARAKQQKK